MACSACEERKRKAAEAWARFLEYIRRVSKA